MREITLVVIMLIPVITLWRESGRLTPIALVSLHLTPVLFGYAQLDALDATNTAFMYCCAVACFTAGHFLHDRRASAAMPVNIYKPYRRSSPAILLFVSIVVTMTFYHFAVSGVPLLSDDVETTRFDFTSSGLFGIPGRMFLFGLPFSVLLVSLGAGRKIARVSARLLLFTWAAYAASSLLSGFKGGLITVLATMLLAKTLSGKPVSLFKLAVGWRVFVVIAALAYCAGISFRYKSLGLASPGDVVPYLAARATRSAAAPGHLVFRQLGTDGSGGKQFAGDTRYFIKKYLPFIASEEEMPLPLDKAISATLYHTPITANAFIVPVTVGGFPELVVNMGWPLAMIAMLGLGMLLSFLVKQAQRSSSAFKGAGFGFAIYVLQIYLLNGNLIYTVFNLVLMTAMLSIVYWLCRLPNVLSARRNVPLYSWPRGSAEGRI
jgi:hypothetical protein